jgi:transposase, IS5 family
MVGELPPQNQLPFFENHLERILDPKHDLVLLCKKIPWERFENEFRGSYGTRGQKGAPIRFVVACLILKQLYNLGDESLVKAWEENPYMQFFTGYSHFCHKFPHDPTVFVRFRKRIGEEGIRFMFKQSLEIQKERLSSDMVISDTTVQENFIQFPTDGRLRQKAIGKLISLASKEGIKLRRTYTREVKQLMRDLQNGKHPKRRKKATKASKRLLTILGVLLRELDRKLSEEKLLKHQELLEICKKIHQQTKLSKNKIYSIHKPHTACIAKGKAHKQYEFGNKVGLTAIPDNLLILSILAFEGNPYDGDTIAPLLEEMEYQAGYLPKEVVYDRGGRGRKEIKGVKVSTPGKPLKSDSEYAKRKKREKFRRRAAIEPIIGHLKSDFRMEQNYLKSENGPTINALLSAMAWNMKKWVEYVLETGKSSLFARIFMLIFWGRSHSKSNQQFLSI